MGPSGLPQLQDLFRRLINLTVPAAFITLTIVLLWGGIKFLTSGGDPNSLKSARELMTWSLLGVLFLALAWVLLLIVHAFTGVDVTNFCLRFDQSC